MIKKMYALGIVGWTIVAMSCASCSSDDSNTTGGPIDPGNDPNFTIVANSDTSFNSFSKKVEVFGLSVYAVSSVEDQKLLHAANVLAQYLDNDEDGTVDNTAVLAAMQSNNASLVMWKTENDLEAVDPPSNTVAQDLGNDETVPNFVSGGKIGEFDAALEEVWHLISHGGYASAYPEVFGESAGTTLSNAMDIARGGHFETIPNPYPTEAWYTYDDATCDYNCMAAEYIYWGLTSILGAQENRLDEIQQEWKLNTSSLMQTTDTALYALLTDTQYKLPTVIPDGTYRH